MGRALKLQRYAASFRVLITPVTGWPAISCNTSCKGGLSGASDDVFTGWLPIEPWRSTKLLTVNFVPKPVPTCAAQADNSRPNCNKVGSSPMASSIAMNGSTRCGNIRPSAIVPFGNCPDFCSSDSQQTVCRTVLSHSSKLAVLPAPGRDLRPAAK